MHVSGAFEIQIAHGHALRGYTYSPNTPMKNWNLDSNPLGACMLARVRTELTACMEHPLCTACVRSAVGKGRAGTVARTQLRGMCRSMETQRTGSK